MAPMLYHGLSQLGLPVICIESRQAYMALKLLATHKTDRNDARGLAHLARTGFFKPVHVKSLPAHAVRSLIIARKKLVGQRVTLENQIRGLAVVFGVRLPRALSSDFIRQALQASDGIPGLSAAMRGLVAARAAVLAAIVAIDGDIRRMVRASDACRRLMSIPGVGQLTALAFTAAVDDPGRFRRSRDIGAYLGLVPRRYQSGEVDYTGSISKCGDRRPHTFVRGRQRHADALQGAAEAQGLGNRDRQTVHNAQGTDRVCSPSRHYHACHVATRHRVRTGLGRAASTRRRSKTELPSGATPREGADDGVDFVACGQHGRLRFQPSRPAPS
jgi:transposase